VRPRRPRQEPAAETLLRNQPHPGPYPPRQLVPRLAEVLAQVAADLLRVLDQVGQRIDEAEELNLQRLVVHRQAREPAVQPRPGAHQRPGTVEPGEDLLPVSLDARFKVATAHRSSWRSFATPAGRG